MQQGEIGYYRTPNVWFLYNNTPKISFSKIELQTLTLGYNDIFFLLTNFGVLKYMYFLLMTVLPFCIESLHRFIFPFLLVYA